MRIAQIVPSLWPAGPVRVVHDLAECLVSLGASCSIYFMSEKSGDANWLVPTERLSFARSAAPARFDIIHSHGIRPDTFLYLRRYQRRFTIVSTIHNYVFEDLNFQYGKFVSTVAGHWWLRVWNKFDGVVCLSQDARNYYRRHGLTAKAFTVANGRSVPVLGFGRDVRCLAIKSFAAGRKILGANGHLTKRKGYETVIRALAELRQFVFVVAGTGDDEPRLRKLADEVGVADRVLFMGYQPRAEVLNACYDIFVLTSLSEGMPLALIEAAAYGKPIVASDLPCVREMFSSGEVRLFKPESIGEFVSAIRYADVNAFALGHRAQLIYARNFSGRAMAERYAAMYARILSCPSQIIAQI